MDLNSTTVFKVLDASDVDCIHHANSVITACHFLRKGALLSRGTVERYGLYQTSQISDDTDKSVGIWFDVFTDSVDIHSRAGKRNIYGPVLFVLDSKLIKKSHTGRVWVTKCNPIDWGTVPREDHWFENTAELKDGFQKGKFAQMVVFRHCGGELHFGTYLKEIILDDPQQKTSKGIDCYSMGYGALSLAMTEGGINVPIKRRKCKRNCKCLVEYAADPAKVHEMFYPGE